MFAQTQAALEAGEREVRPINFNEEIRVDEGSLFIRKGLLTYVAEKAEMPARAGKRDHCLRIIFSNGMESDPLLSSFWKALADDATVRAIHRHGLGAMDPDWEADRIDLTGTVYVVRSKSKEPAIAEVSGILLKIGVTTQEVRRRVADARNDPTFLLAPVEVVATYDLINLNWRKVQEPLHRHLRCGPTARSVDHGPVRAEGVPAGMALCPSGACEPGGAGDPGWEPA